MSLIFKPRIPESFSFGGGRMQESKPKVVPPEAKPKVVPPKAKVWTNKEIQKLVDLRAMGCSYKDCGPLMGRSATGVATFVVHRDLYGVIAKKRKELIANITGRC